jgi:hypothetical protein
VDVQVVMKGTWTAAVGLSGLGADLLDGMTVKGGAAFETWLLAQQRHAAAASEAVLHEAAVGSMARGALGAAIDYAARAAAMSPLDENHQALLIRLYRMAGDDDAAAKQLAAFMRVLGTELGVAPGPVVQAAMREPRYVSDEIADEATIEAVAEAGAAAVSAGAVEAGVHSLRTAARMADGAGATRLRISTRLVLAEALIHALGGLDEPGLTALHEADEIALAHELPGAAAQARAELGYVNFLRGRYDRAELWLTDARTRCNRLADPYLWLDVYILDAQCELGLRHGHADVSGWVETMRKLASRMDMKELALRSLRHGAALGYDGDAAAAAVLAEEIDARL